MSLLIWEQFNAVDVWIYGTSQVEVTQTQKCHALPSLAARWAHL